MADNPNDLLNDIKEKSIKKGYDTSDKKEFSFVRKFLASYGLPTKNFDENLKSLRIVSSKGDIGYNPKTNTISGIEKGPEFIHELYHMASNINDETANIGAYSAKGYGKSLNEGFVEHLTFISYNANYRMVYPVEESYAAFLKELYGEDLLLKFIEGDTNSFYEYFGKDRSGVVLLTKLLDAFTNKIIISRDLMAKKEYNAIGECYDKAFDALLVFIIQTINFFRKKDSARAYEFLNDIEDIIYYNYQSDIEASRYKNFDNFVRIVESNIKNLDRGV